MGVFTNSENNSGLIKPMNQTNLSSHLPILRSSSFCLASFQNLPRWLTVSIHLSAPRRDCQSLGPCGRGGHETATVLPLCATTLKIDLCLLSQVRWVPLMGQKCSCTSNAVYAYIRVIILPTQRIHFQGQITEPYHTFAFFDPSKMSNLMTPVILLPHRFSLSVHIWFQSEWNWQLYVRIEPDFCGNCDSWAFHHSILVVAYTCTDTPFLIYYFTYLFSFSDYDFTTDSIPSRCLSCHIPHSAHKTTRGFKYYTPRHWKITYPLVCKK